MKALQVQRAAPIEERAVSLVELPEPEPAEGELLLRVRACGLCRTDLHIAEGEVKAPLPVTLGHQVVGVVEKRGPGAARFREGERAAACWLATSCGRCALCAEERENLCPEARFTGLTAPGGMAERMIVREDFAFKLPEIFSDREAAPLLCAGAVGYRALKLCELPKAGKIGLFGFGSSAHLILQLALARGHAAAVFTRGEAHRTLAGKLGASWVGGAGERPPWRLDAAIIFAPNGALVPPALEALAPAGRLVLADIHMSDLPPLPYRLLWQERSITTVANVARADVAELLEEAARTGLKPSVAAYGLDSAVHAMLDLKAGRLEASAVILL